MSELNPPQKYDPDVIDPIIVKEYRSPWSLIIPITLAVISLWFLTTSFRVPDPYSPGVWRGRLDYLEGSNDLFIGAICASAAILVALICLRKILSLVLIGCLMLIGSQFGAFMPKFDSGRDPAPRCQAELPQYKQALATNQKFGDQLTADIDGRKLTLWRWVARNAASGGLGVIYDPKDKLSKDDQTYKFCGYLTTVRKIEPNWYFVKTSYD